MRRFAFAVAALSVQIWPGPAWAADSVPAAETEESRKNGTRIGGSFRLRFESPQGFFGSRYGTMEDESYLLARLRVHLEHERPQLGRLRIEFQDARAAGLPVNDASFQGRNHPFRDYFDVNQLYWENRCPDHWWWKVGRQSISFADRRLFGPGDWGNTGRYVWDAAQGGFTASALETTLVLGRPVIHDPGRWPNRLSTTPTAFLLWSRLPVLPGEIAGFYLFRDEGPGTAAGSVARTSHSFGYYLDERTDSWSLKSLLAAQRGRQGPGAVRAWGWMGAFAWKFRDPWHTELELQHVIGSGDSDPGDETNETFDGLFSGADTVLYGWMNLCFWRNLEEYRISIETKPVFFLTLRAEFHAFRLREAKDAWYGPGGPVRWDPSGNSGRDLGSELDLVARIVGRTGFEVLGGGGWFFPGTFVHRTGSAPRGGWLFIQFSIPFAFRL